MTIYVDLIEAQGPPGPPGPAGPPGTGDPQLTRTLTAAELMAAAEATPIVLIAGTPDVARIARFMSLRRRAGSTPFVGAGKLSVGCAGTLGGIGEMIKIDAGFVTQAGSGVGYATLTLDNWGPDSQIVGRNLELWLASVPSAGDTEIDITVAYSEVTV